MNNGLGLTIEEANNELSKIEKVFDFFYDNPDVYRNWRELVVNHSVTGVKVHDARIVAAMKAHGIDICLLLTQAISNNTRSPRFLPPT